MKHIGTFQSKQWGTVNVMRATYGGQDGPLAIVLELEPGEPLAELSVNMYKPECSHDSKDLPPDCFYMKTWGENEIIASEAMESGLFSVRGDISPAHCGFCAAMAWQIVQ